MKSFKLTTNHLILAGTLFILGLGYFLYLKVYIRERENDIIATRLRVLSQIGKNIDEKVTSYQNNADLLGKKLEAQFNSTYSSSSLERARMIMDSTMKNFSDKQYVQGLEFVDLSKDDNPGTVNYFPEQAGYKYFRNIPVKLDGHNRLITFRVKYNFLLQGIFWKDVFHDFVLLEDSVVDYTTLSSNLVLNIVPGSSEKSGTELQIHNGSEPQSIQLASGETYDINISNIPYKLFLQPVYVNNKLMYAGGLVEESSYVKEKHNIALRLLLILSFVLLLLILSLPIIKLKVISITEMTGPSSIIFSALSVFLGGTLTIVFVYFILQNSSRVNMVDKHLADLSMEVYNNFDTELTSIYKELNHYDSAYAFIRAGSLNTQGKKSGNPVYRNKNMWWNIEELPSDSLAKPRYYNYFDYVMWIDKNGRQAYQVTPFKDSTLLISVRERDYFNKAGEWFLGKSDTDKFMLESIVSLRNSSFKGAVSIRRKYGDDPSVIALTSRLYSVIDPILPKDYHFCIIDESGNVWFHSNKERNLRENFIQECDNSKKISAAIYANISKPININYYNKPRRAYICPIDRLPLYLVTYYDKDAEQSYQTQIFTFDAFLISLLIAYIFIMTMVMLIIGHITQRKFDKNLMVEITRPKKMHEKHYLVLRNLNIVISVIFGIMAYSMNGMQALLAAFMMISVSFGYSYDRLNRDEPPKSKRRFFAGFCLFLILLLNMVAYSALNWQQFVYILIFQAIIYFTIFLAEKISAERKIVKDSRYARGIKVFLERSFPRSIRFNQSYLVKYSGFLLSILLLSGIMPSLKFIQSTYESENQVRLKHILADLMKKEDTRDQQVNAYYLSLNPTKHTADLKAARKKLGIYTDFLQGIHSAKGTITGAEVRPATQLWDTMVSFMRPEYDDYISDNKYLVFNPSHTDRMNWVQKDGQVYLNYISKSNQAGSKNSKLNISGILPLSRAFFPESEGSLWNRILMNTLFLLISALILILLFRLIEFTISRLFGTHYVHWYSPLPVANVIRQKIMSGGRVMIVRQSVFDESDKLLSDIFSGHDQGLSNVFEIHDWQNEEGVNLSKKLLSTTSEKENSGKPGVRRGHGLVPGNLIIDHFDADIEQPSTFENKLKLLDQMYRIKSINIIVLTDTHPDRILENIHQIISGAKESEEKTEIWQEKAQEFIYIINETLVLYLPINYHHSVTERTTHCIESSRMENFRQILWDEAFNSNYLWNYKRAVIRNQKTDKKLPEDMRQELIIRQFSELARNYYQNLLAACSDKEKYLLADFAPDQIMNPNNKNTVFILLRKGLLVKKCDRISFMNESFRRYVIKILTKPVTNELQTRMSEGHQTWKGYKIVLTLIIVAIFGFIMLANRDLLANMKEMFVALGGGIAVITGILGLISSRKKASND